MNMQVLLDHQIFSMQRYGGVSKYFVELTRAVNSELSPTITIFAPGYVNQYLSRCDSLHWASFPFPYFQKGLRFRPYLLAPLLDVVLALNRYSIVHETHYGLAKAGSHKGVSIVTTVHDMIYEKLPSFIHDAGSSASEKRRRLIRADRIICVSHNTRRDLLSLYPELEAKVAVVHHGARRVPAVTLADFDYGVPFVLYVGVRAGYKNFVTLVHAMGRSRFLKGNFRLVCFGGGPLIASELELIAQVGLERGSVVQLQGSDGHLASLYEAAAVYAFPSKYEGFGMPLVEAMSHGCPIACSRASSFPEICGDSAAYFEPDSIDSVQACLERVLQDSQERAQLALLSGARAAHFTWARCALETAKVYRSIG